MTSVTDIDNQDTCVISISERSSKDGDEKSIPPIEDTNGNSLNDNEPRKAKRTLGVGIKRNPRYVNIPSHRVRDLGERNGIKRYSSFNFSDFSYMIIPISNVIESVVVDGQPTFFDFRRQVTRI